MAMKKLIIRPYPKVIFFYPTFFLSLFILIYANFGGALDGYAGRICGSIFAVIFIFNLLVFALNFTKHIFINIFIGCFALACLMIAANEKYPELLGQLGAVIRGVEIVMNKGFYAFMTFSFGLTFLIVIFDTRFEYCEITPNEIIFHYGFLSDVKRYPAPSLKYDQVITDVFEYMLLRAGNIKLTPAGEREPFILENIPFIKKKFKALDEILSATEVQVVPQKPQQENSDQRAQG